MATVQAPQIAVSARPVKGLRDTGIDFIRALCVVGVVLLHAIMVGVTVTDAGPVFENASDGTWWITPLSWILQVMPLFFIIGGFSGLIAYRRTKNRGGTATGFVAGRLHRLLRPAMFTIGIVGALLALLAVVGVPADLIATAGFRYGQPLWFLGVFLLCQALLPLFAAAHERAPFLAIGVLASTAVAVDALRQASGIDGLGFLNLAFVWLTLQQLGFFFADGSIDALPRRTRALAAAGALAILIGTFLFGVYSPDLVANINPPTAALLLVGVVHIALVSLYRDRLQQLSRRPHVAAFTAFVTRRTMTIYLWHMPVLLAMAGLSAVGAIVTGVALPDLDSAGWWLGRPLWLALALALTALVAIAFTRFETAAAPRAHDSARRLSIATLIGLSAVLMLLVFGTSVVTAGIAVALIVLSLRLSRRGVSGESSGGEGVSDVVRVSESDDQQRNDGTHTETHASRILRIPHTIGEPRHHRDHGDGERYRHRHGIGVDADPSERAEHSVQHGEQVGHSCGEREQAGEQHEGDDSSGIDPGRHWRDENRQRHTEEQYDPSQPPRLHGENAHGKAGDGVEPAHRDEHGGDAPDVVRIQRQRESHRREERELHASR